ncbi:ribosomal protein subunit L31 [Pochonia chlamydosporia 170]|uniref:Ribosomal protein subunit L31 n=1 Tax=Pochonia chlamydosporia 170 TaxID=1380566 RepID=A0A179FSK5_METCM|nr:ribosomal protein subunit L31 [Pochonia chlamydosporia 170]OAQ67999.1 ribosomal protein subunit L31 [Pochonia chlamydosporia 170]
MFGPFRITNPLSGGLLWKIPWRLSRFQKRRHRLRLRAVDSVVATLDSALAKKGQTLEALERWKAEMPTEAEMLPKDKYTIFDRKAKRYRKGIHSMFVGMGGCGRGFRNGLTLLVIKRRRRSIRMLGGDGIQVNSPAYHDNHRLRSVEGWNLAIEWNCLV